MCYDIIEQQCKKNKYITCLSLNTKTNPNNYNTKYDDTTTSEDTCILIQRRRTTTTVNENNILFLNKNGKMKH